MTDTLCASVSVPHMVWDVETPDRPGSAFHPEDELRVRRRAKRPKRPVETMEYLAAAERFLRAAGRRVADADEPELQRLADLGRVHREVVTEAIRGMRARGVSWPVIGRALGVTGDAARMQWGQKTLAVAS